MLPGWSNISQLGDWLNSFCWPCISSRLSHDGKATPTNLFQCLTELLDRSTFADIIWTRCQPCFQVGAKPPNRGTG